MMMEEYGPNFWKPWNELEMDEDSLITDLEIEREKLLRQFRHEIEWGRTEHLVEIELKKSRTFRIELDIKFNEVFPEPKPIVMTHKEINLNKLSPYLHLPEKLERKSKFHRKVDNVHEQMLDFQKKWDQQKPLGSDTDDFLLDTFADILSRNHVETMQELVELPSIDDCLKEVCPVDVTLKPLDITELLKDIQDEYKTGCEQLQEIRDQIYVQNQSMAKSIVVTELLGQVTAELFSIEVNSSDDSFSEKKSSFVRIEKPIPFMKWREKMTFQPEDYSKKTNFLSRVPLDLLKSPKLFSRSSASFENISSTSAGTTESPNTSEHFAFESNMLFQTEAFRNLSIYEAASKNSSQIESNFGPRRPTALPGTPMSGMSNRSNSSPMSWRAEEEDDDGPPLPDKPQYRVPLKVSGGVNSMMMNKKSLFQPRMSTPKSKHHHAELERSLSGISTICKSPKQMAHMPAREEVKRKLPIYPDDPSAQTSKHFANTSKIGFKLPTTTQQQSKKIKLLEFPQKLLKQKNKNLQKAEKEFLDRGQDHEIKTSFDTGMKNWRPDYQFHPEPEELYADDPRGMDYLNKESNAEDSFYQTDQQSLFSLTGGGRGEPSRSFFPSFLDSTPRPDPKQRRMRNPEMDTGFAWYQDVTNDQGMDFHYNYGFSNGKENSFFNISTQSTTDHNNFRLNFDKSFPDKPFFKANLFENQSRFNPPEKRPTPENQISRKISPNFNPKNRLSPNDDGYPLPGFLAKNLYRSSGLKNNIIQQPKPLKKSKIIKIPPPVNVMKKRPANNSNPRTPPGKPPKKIRAKKIDMDVLMPKSKN